MARAYHGVVHPFTRFYEIVGVDADLTAGRYVLFRTFRNTGRSAQTPVWSLAHGDRLWIWTQADSFKVKRLRSVPRCELALCNATGRAQYSAFVTGHARMIHDPASVAEAFALVKAKYGWQATAMALVIEYLRGAPRMAVIEVELAPAAQPVARSSRARWP